MAQQEPLARLLASVAENNGCQTWNTWHRSFYDGFMYTNNVDLRGVDLSFLDLHNVNLGDARLYDAQCRGTNLRWANLRRAILTGANLEEAELNHANLDRAVLRDANLRHANLSHADMRRAQLERALLEATNFSAASFIGIDVTCDFRTCILTGATIASIRGTPLWPAIPAETLHELEGEACNPTTSPGRLNELAFTWPGYLVQEQIAANPNASPPLLLDLALHYPIAFLRNPALPLLFLENPRWIDAEEAGDILAVIKARPDYALLEQIDAPMLQLLQHCAR